MEFIQTNTILTVSVTWSEKTQAAPLNPTPTLSLLHIRIQDTDFATLKNSPLACVCVCVSEPWRCFRECVGTCSWWALFIKIPPTWIHTSHTHYTHTNTHSAGHLYPVKVRGPCAGMFVLHNDLIVPWYGLSEPRSVAESHLFHLCQRADKARDASISI